MAAAVGAVGLSAIVATIIVGRSPLSLLGRPPHREAIARARTYLGAGRPDLALRAVGRIGEGEPGGGEALTVAGLALDALGRRAEALVALERALTRQPDQPTAHEALASIYRSSGDYGRGLAHLRSAADLDPNDPLPWIAMAKAYRDLGQVEDSADSYQAAYDRDPTNREARLGFIAAALEVRRPDQATPHLVEALRETPEDAPVLGLAARHAHALGHPEQAASFAARALARDPDNFDALIARATSCSLRGEPNAALEVLERAVKVNPTSVHALTLLAQVEARQGLADRARASISRARAIEDRLATFVRLAGEINRRPDDVGARCKMGEAAALVNRPDIAANSFLAALALDPHCRPARIGLAALNERGGGTPPSP